MPEVTIKKTEVYGKTDKKFLAGSFLEAESLYKSPYFPESYYFPYNPDPLARGNNYDIYDEMRDDDQVKACISFKKDLVVNSGWVVECENKDISEEVINGLKDMEQEGRLDMAFEDILRGIVSSGYEFGFGIGEPVYKLSNNKYVYDTVKVRPPHTFRFVIDDYGNVLEVVQSTSKGDKSFKPELFLHYTYQSDYGNPYGKSDLRAAHSAWKAKKFVNRFLAIYLERYASPTIIGKFPSNWDTNEISRYHTLLRSIQQMTTMVIPESAIVEFVQANRDASDVYIRSLNYYNMLIARSILVPDLIGISGEQTSGGSYSLGDKQFKLFLSTIEKDRQALSRKITLRLIRPIVKANYGDIPCEFRFLPYGDENNVDLLRIWSEAIRGRIFKPNPEEINHLRKQLKFPEGPVEIQEPQESSIPDLRERNLFTQIKEFKFKRELTLYEKKVDFSKIQETLRSSGDGIIKELTRIVERMARDLIQQAKDKKIVDKFRPEKINELEPKFRKELNDAFRGHFIGLFKQGKDNAQKELRCSQKRFVEEDIIPEEFEKIIKAEAFKLTGDMSDEVRKKVANRMFDGVKNGLPPSEIAESIFSDLKKYTDNQIETIVHTKTSEVFNAARMTFFNSDPIARNLIAGYQYSAILDETTCFEAGTKIKLADGRYKPIEQFVPGDFILSGSRKIRRVLATKQYIGKKWIRITLESGEQIKATETHPFWAIRQGKSGWVEARDLLSDDRIGKVSLSNLQEADNFPEKKAEKILQQSVQIQVYDRKDSLGDGRCVLAQKQIGLGCKEGIRNSFNGLGFVENQDGQSDGRRESEILSRCHAGNTPFPTSYTRIARTERVWDTAPCYDLEVESDHSYLVSEEDLIAHNTELCSTLDQMIFDADKDADYIAQISPGSNHWNCRSLWVPVTSFEQPEFDRPIPIEKLRKLGGTLLSKEGNLRRYTHELFHPVEPLTVSLEFRNFGDNVLIPKPEDDLFIKILKVSCHNAHTTNPVTIGFKAGENSDLHYVSTLESMTGKYEIDFKDEGWILPSGSSLIINLNSTDVLLSVTCRYVIVDKSGQRIR